MAKPNRLSKEDAHDLSCIQDVVDVLTAGLTPEDISFLHSIQAREAFSSKATSRDVFQDDLCRCGRPLDEFEEIVTDNENDAVLWRCPDCGWSMSDKPVVRR